VPLDRLRIVRSDQLRREFDVGQIFAVGVEVRVRKVGRPAQCDPVSAGVRKLALVR
jgi:hypothetical protein